VPDGGGSGVPTSSSLLEKIMVHTVGAISIAPAISIAARHFSINFWHLKKQFLTFFFFYPLDWSILYKKSKEKIEKYFS
jgi:hypothetical protein